MAKKNKREKRFMTEQEKYLRSLMNELQVSQTEIADYENVTEQAINQQLLRLTPSKLEKFENVIKEIAQKNGTREY